MPDKHFDFNLNGRHVRVEANEDGSCRYMVRMSDAVLPGAFRMRIGYLTGRQGTWLAEAAGIPSIPATSAKQACLALARVATVQPTANRP